MHVFQNHLKISPANTSAGGGFATFPVESAPQPLFHSAIVANNTHTDSLRSIISRWAFVWRCCLCLKTCWNAIWIVHARSPKPRVNQCLGATLAAACSHMLISNDFPFWLQCEAAQQRWDTWGKYTGNFQELSLAFDLPGWLLSIVRFHLVAVNGDESGVCWHLHCWQHLKEAQCCWETSANKLNLLQFDAIFEYAAAVLLDFFF